MNLGLFACLLEIQGRDIFLHTQSLNKYDVGSFESEKNGLQTKNGAFSKNPAVGEFQHPTFIYESLTNTLMDKQVPHNAETSKPCPPCILLPLKLDLWKNYMTKWPVGDRCIIEIWPEKYEKWGMATNVIHVVHPDIWSFKNRNLPYLVNAGSSFMTHCADIHISLLSWFGLIEGFL